jgi:predicted metal-dependent TIM-barrel fold hydrolase
MRIFDPHVHMYARTTMDYEAMARAGIEVIVEPAFWLGQPRRRAETFFDYFDHMLEYEHERAAQYGIRQFVALAMNPREANDRSLAEAVFAELPRYLEHERVVAVGEIGFDRLTPEEEEFFLRQALLARDFGLPILVHSPHTDKRRGIERIIGILREVAYPPQMVLIDHNTEETTPLTRAADMWAGHTVYPITKVSPERAAHIVQRHGVERMMINSAADWGPSDPLMVPHTIEELRAIGIAERDIERLVWDNPVEFFSQSGRLKI